MAEKLDSVGDDGAAEVPAKLLSSGSKAAITVTDDDESEPYVGDDEGASVRLKDKSPDTARKVEHEDDEDDEDELDDDGDDSELEASPAAKKPTFDRSDLALARDLGIERSEIEECETPAELKAVIRTAVRRQKSQPAAVAKPVADDDEFDFGLTEEEREIIDPDVLKIQEKIGRKLAKQVQDLQKSIAGDKAAKEQERIDGVLRQVERTFGKIARPSLLGENGKLTKDQLVRRQAIITLAFGVGMNGTTAERVKAATDMLYPSKKAPKEEDKPEPKAKRSWRRAALATPTSRKAASDTSERARTKAAVKEVDKLLRSLDLQANGTVVHDEQDDGV